MLEGGEGFREVQTDLHVRDVREVGEIGSVVVRVIPVRSGDYLIWSSVMCQVITLYGHYLPTPARYPLEVISQDPL